ncbi:hypothetical protein VM98_36285, partial [Streptomyces rubellomurinus subsp. indigoferus]
IETIKEKSGGDPLLAAGGAPAAKRTAPKAAAEVTEKPARRPKAAAAAEAPAAAESQAQPARYDDAQFGASPRGPRRRYPPRRGRPGRHASASAGPLPPPLRPAAVLLPFPRLP